MSNEDDFVISELRSAWATGEAPSGLLRLLKDRGFGGARLITLFQSAFGLPLAKTNAIAGWLTHGDDMRVDRYLGRFMPSRLSSEQQDVEVQRDPRRD